MQKTSWAAVFQRLRQAVLTKFMAYDKNGIRLAPMPQCSMKPANQTSDHIVMDNGMFARKWPKSHKNKADRKARMRRGIANERKSGNPAYA